MARLIPKVEVEEISLKPERDTALFLVNQLPDNCIIYHSYPWLNSERNDRGNTTLKEGETDFVIILPSHGMLILCLLYTSPSPRDATLSRMPSSA